MSNDRFPGSDMFDHVNVETTVETYEDQSSAFGNALLAEAEATRQNMSFGEALSATARENGYKPVTFEPGSDIKSRSLGGNAAYRPSASQGVQNLLLRDDPVGGTSSFSDKPLPGEEEVIDYLETIAKGSYKK